MTTAEAVMTTQDVANRMNELFKENKWDVVQEELYAEDAVSIEPDHAQGLKSVKGMAAIKQKGKDFSNMIEEMHGGWHSEPIVAGNFISFGMGMDCTMKGMGRTKMDEIAVYEVKDGKVVKEQFFF
jgi:SnoaL-like domain